MVYFLYRYMMQVVALVAKNTGFLNSRLRDRNIGLKSQEIEAMNHCVWIHCASLGEFEQGKVLIDELRLRYPDKKLVLTFFSSSGFGKKRNYDRVDQVLYLPYDTPAAMGKFVSRLQPELVIFVKYEFWFTLLDVLASRDIPFVFVSASFRPDQYLFRPFFSGLLEKIGKAAHLFVQNYDSKKLLNSHRYNEVSVSGDTRIDRVLELSQQEFNWPALREWTYDGMSVITGSTWPKDEKLILESMPDFEQWKWVLAPHDVSQEHINTLREEVGERAVFLSDIGMEKTIPANRNILVIDRIGLLSRIYRYGNIAYIGGGFGAGIHNTLEPAVYGLPLIFGPRYEKFQEAVDFWNLGTARVIQTSDDLDAALRYFENPVRRDEVAASLTEYFKENAGATRKIMTTIEKLITQ